MSLSNLKVFSSYLQGSMTEVLAENVELFNAATNGGMVLATGRNDGDYDDETYWARLSGLVKRRNAYGSGAVAALDLSQLSDTSVKVAAGTPPVNIDPGMLRWILKSPEEAGVVYGTQLAEERMADMVESGVGAFSAAIPQVANNYLDAKTGPISFQLLNKAAAKLGDQASRITTWLMHSTPMHDLYDDALTNSNRLFTFGTVQVIEDGFGRRLIMSDAAALLNTEGAEAGVDSFNVCGLQSGAVMIEDNGDYTENIETSNGDENIARTIQSEWSYNTGIKGFAWDKANGGASPNNAAITTPTNWDRQATSHKDLAGVLLEVRASV